MTNHTPGPWTLERHAETGNYSIQADGLGFVTVYANRSDEVLNDARLIAAAPDMLARLEYVVDWLEDAKVHADIVSNCRATIALTTKGK